MVGVGGNIERPVPVVSATTVGNGPTINERFKANGVRMRLPR